jgi:hypothetical protein
VPLVGDTVVWIRQKAIYPYGSKNKHDANIPKLVDYVLEDEFPSGALLNRLQMTFPMFLYVRLMQKHR